MRKIFLILWSAIFAGLLTPVFANIQHEQRQEVVSPKLKTSHQAKNVLFQVGSITSLYNGVFDADYSYANLFKHGDFGVGTFEHLDGEMVAMDGLFYQANENGKLQAVQPTQKTPFAEVTFFTPSEHFEVPSTTNFKTLNTFIQSKFPNKNIPYALRIEGSFSHLTLRGIHAQQPPYPKLTEAAKGQHVFDLSNTKGTLVGFWFPQYLANVGEVGLHFHFISQDKAIGGHVLEFEVDSAQALIQGMQQIQLYFPATEGFSKTDFGNGVAADEQNINLITAAQQQGNS